MWNFQNTLVINDTDPVARTHTSLMLASVARSDTNDTNASHPLDCPQNETAKKTFTWKSIQAVIGYQKSWRQP